MKIAFFSQYFYPESFSNNEIAVNLVERGHDVHAISCVPNYPAGIFFKGYSNQERREEVWKGVKIHRTRTKARGKSSASLVLNYLVYPFAAMWTCRRRIRDRPDVSFVSMPSPLFQALAGIFLKWFRGTPCVFWVQDIWPESAIFTLQLKNPIIVYPLTWLCGWIYRRADLILVQSASFPSMIERFGVTPDKIRIFPNTAPSDYVERRAIEAPAEAEYVPQTGFRLMFAGNIGESQDFDTLIEAAHILRECQNLHWVVLGTGRDMARAQSLIEERKLAEKFHFLGRHPLETMPFFFAHADAMLVSLKNSEIFSLTVPYKIQCYMACSKPIIASLSGEGARIIEEADCGFTAPASQPQELANVIKKMLELTTEERGDMGKSARTYFDNHYSAQKIYDELEAWLIEASCKK